MGVTILNDLIDDARAAFQHRFDGVIAILVAEIGVIMVDGNHTPPKLGLKSADKPLAANCIWRADDETLKRVFEGGRAFESAFLSGRLTIEGDMAVMARLELETAQ